MEYSGQSRVPIQSQNQSLETASSHVQQIDAPRTEDSVWEHDRRVMRLCIQSPSPESKPKPKQQGGQWSQCGDVCVEIITTGLARTGTRARRMEPEWDYGIMELWNYGTQPKPRRGCEIRTEQDRMDRTGQGTNCHWPTGPQKQNQGHRKAGTVTEYICSCALMQPCSHAAAMQQPSTGTDRGGRGVHDSI